MQNGHLHRVLVAYSNNPVPSITNVIPRLGSGSIVVMVYWLHQCLPEELV
jgi:hypothetical protein